MTQEEARAALTTACAAAHKAANACIASISRRDLVAATGESTTALDRLEDARTIALGLCQSDWLDEYESAQRAAMNAAKRVKNAVRGIWYTGGES